MGTVRSFHHGAVSVDTFQLQTCPACEEAGPVGSLLTMEVLIGFFLPYYLQPWTPDSFITPFGHDGNFSGTPSATLA